MQGEKKDWLFILTERYQFCVLKYNEETGDLETKANGQANEKVGRPTDMGQVRIRHASRNGAAPAHLGWGGMGRPLGKCRTSKCTSAVSLMCASCNKNRPKLCIVVKQRGGCGAPKQLA